MTGKGDFDIVTVNSDYRLTEKGEIPGHKVGGQWRFMKQGIDRWLRAKGKSH